MRSLLFELGDLLSEHITMLCFSGSSSLNRDWASYDPDLKTAINGTVIPSISTDYPRILSIGPSFFESYLTWPDTRFIHGFNLAHNGSRINHDLLETVSVACKALGGKLAYWELGNEPNNYKTAYQGAFRPTNWTTQDIMLLLEKPFQ